MEYTDHLDPVLNSNFPSIRVEASVSAPRPVGRRKIGSEAVFYLCGMVCLAKKQLSLLFFKAAPFVLLFFHHHVHGSFPPFQPKWVLMF